MKRFILFFVLIFFVNLTNAGRGNRSNTEIYEEYTVCGDYANAIATYAQLMWGADYWTTWYNAYGECIENYY